MTNDMGGLEIEKIRKHKNRKKTESEAEKSPLSFLNKNITLGPSGLGDKEKEEFYMGLYSMVSSGIAIKSALELIISEEKKEKIRSCYQFLDSDIVKGSSLSAAMKRTEKFSPYEYYTIQIGEETGRLEEVLSELANYYTSRLRQRRQFISAISYPVIVLLTSLGAVSFLLLFMVPMFESIFSRFGGELPGITLAVINFSNFVLDHLGFLLFLFIGCGVAYLYIRRKDWYRQTQDLWLIKLPLFGQIYLGMAMARFCKSMSLLISSKVPLVQSLDLMEDMISFYPIKKAIQELSKDLFNGNSLHHAMSRHPIFAPKLVTMIKIGEEVNQLDTFFNKIAESYSNDVEFRTSQLNTFLEPLLIIVLGLVVGFILITMYLPMFQISTNLGM